MGDSQAEKGPGIETGPEAGSLPGRVEGYLENTMNLLRGVIRRVIGKTFPEASEAQIQTDPELRRAAEKLQTGDLTQLEAFYKKNLWPPKSMLQACCNKTLSGPSADYAASHYDYFTQLIDRLDIKVRSLSWGLIGSRFRDETGQAKPGCKKKEKDTRERELKAFSDRRSEKQSE